MPLRSANISSITDHAAKRMFKRDVMPGDIAQTANNPTVRFKYNHGTTLYLNNQIGLFVDDAAQRLISVISKSSSEGFKPLQNTLLKRSKR